MAEVNFEEAVPLWNKEFVVPLLTCLKLAPGTAEFAKLTNVPSSTYTCDNNPSGVPLYCPSYPTSQKTLKCSCCEATFSEREEQIAHYRLDWHRFNLKRSLEGLSPVSKIKFTNGTWKTEETKQDDNSDAEEDDDDDEFNEDHDDIVIQRKPRIYLINADNDVVSILRTLLYHKKSEIWSETELIQKVCAAPRKLYWTIILVAGGHFAAAVFQGEDVVVHKTFHSYTVRAKQGKTQTGRDNKNATSHPRSAGASLRRYNEQAHNQHIQDILEEWKDHISKCHLIFCKCPKNNSQVIFGGQTPIIARRDERLRSIPFPSKKPSFSEVRRIHKMLSCIYVHGKLSDVAELEKTRTVPSKKPISSPSKTPSKKPANSKKLSKGELARLDTEDACLLGRSSSDEDLNDLVTSFERVDFDHLQPFGSTTEDNRKRKKKEKSESVNISSPTLMGDEKTECEDICFPELRKVENFVYTMCRTGDLHGLRAIYQLSKFRDFTQVSDAVPNYVANSLLNMDPDFEILGMKFGESEKTLLHIAAENAHKNLIWWLLDEGCDPCVPNRKEQTPYIATKVKESRNHFRRYMAAHPNKYDYEKADIPGPLTNERESNQKAKLAEKKKRQKTKKEEKEKEWKIREEQRKREQEEKEKYLKLSDREKRALAAEKRIQAAQASAIETISTTQRCFQCAQDISKSVPFEYCEFKFCSTACVKEHRGKSKALK